MLFAIRVTKYCLNRLLFSKIGQFTQIPIMTQFIAAFKAVLKQTRT